MAGYVPVKVVDAKEELIVGLRTYVKHYGGIQKAAAKMGMSDHDLAKVLRLDRTVSIGKLHDMGEAIGLKLDMRWVEKNGSL